MPSPSLTHSHTIGAEVSMMSTDEFGDIWSVSMDCRPATCITCCAGRTFDCCGVGCGVCPMLCLI